jgi:hypothetical protein
MWSLVRSDHNLAVDSRPVPAAFLHPGLDLDIKAATAALTLPHTTGERKASTRRRKCRKRQMRGRVGSDFLRHRIFLGLSHARPSPKVWLCRIFGGVTLPQDHAAGYSTETRASATAAGRVSMVMWFPGMTSGSTPSRAANSAPGRARAVSSAKST